VQLGPTVIPNGQGSLTSGARVNVTGRITGIVVDPTSPLTIYLAAAGGGIWKTVDGGVTWFATSDNELSLAIGALAMAPSDHNRLYAGTGEGNVFFFALNRPLSASNEDYHGVGVLRSSDGGGTWTLVGSAELTGAAFYRIAVHPTDPDVLFGAIGGGLATSGSLMRSQDGGATWTAITSGLPALSTSVISCTDVAYDPTNADRAWCAFWGSGIFRTDNANAATPTWTKLTTGLPASGISRIDCRGALKPRRDIRVDRGFPCQQGTPERRVREHRRRQHLVPHHDVADYRGLLHAKYRRRRLHSGRALCFRFRTLQVRAKRRRVDRDQRRHAHPSGQPRVRLTPHQ
jgi:hypothetical protein